jgi:hypothetical protein
MIKNFELEDGYNIIILENIIDNYRLLLVCMNRGNNLWN